MHTRYIQVLIFGALTSCSSTALMTQRDADVSGERVSSEAQGCDVDQWRARGHAILAAFPRWCEGDPDAQNRALEWADARGLVFETEFGNVIKLETAREYAKGSGPHARIERLASRSVKALTCADITEMLESSEGCGVEERVDTTPNQCASGALTLDPEGVGESTALGCVPLSRAQCAARPECARFGACTPSRGEAGRGSCVVASDEDCSQIEACRVEGLECRFDAEHGSCVIPGCSPDEPAGVEGAGRARWEERARAWSLDSDRQPGESSSVRISRLLAACDHALPGEGSEVHGAYGVHETPDGFVGAFKSSSRQRMNEAEIVRVTEAAGRISIEHVASVENVLFAGWDACAADAQHCVYDSATRTMMTGAPSCDEERELSACELWSAREQDWAHDLGREDLEGVLRGHLGRCGEAVALIEDLQTDEASMKFVHVAGGEGRADALLLAQRVGGSWRLEVVEGSVHEEEGLQVSASVRLVDDELRQAFHAGPFDASFRYQTAVSATYGTFYEGEPACCDNATMFTEVEVFLMSSQVDDETRWSPKLSVVRRTEDTSESIGDITAPSGTRVAIEAIDAKRWRLRTTNYMGESKARVISVEPSRLEPVAGCAAP